LSISIRNSDAIKTDGNVVKPPNSSSHARRFCGLLLLYLSAPLVLVSIAQRAPSVNLLWDVANAMGYLALALIILLFVYTGRPRAFPAFSGGFFAALHRHFGFIALALIVGHTGILLYAEPLLVEHLKLTAPVHMLTGLASALVILLLTATSITVVRRRLWEDYQRFRGVHAWLSIAALALLLLHVLGSGYYLNTSWKMVALLLVCAIVLGFYIDKRYVHLRHDRSVVRQRHTSHYAVLLAYAPVGLVLVICFGVVIVYVGDTG
tara:strand:+ start:133021 stop:133812 length:792 start_codon:yes stop_codon:yes gene_type:complete